MLRMKTGIVVIGRNEGERLIACLDALAGEKWPIVYVDSGSTDGSQQAARARGAEVVALDLSTPFTAARARNAGFERLRSLHPSLAYVQFVDGDCVIIAGWIEAAQSFLDSHPQAAVACGRVRERHPERSVYNWLCDVEWDTPIGMTEACGGIAMMRADALVKVGGFNPGLIAGEEPELCLRLRMAGFEIWRLDRDMTYHDANIMQFGQWWTRMKRGGFAFAAVRNLHRNSRLQIWMREYRRALIWGLALPLLILLGGILYPPLFLGALIYPLQIARIALRRGATDSKSWLYALFMTLGKFAEASGIANCAASGYRRKTTLVENK